MVINEIIERLKEGNRRFVSGTSEGKLQDPERRKTLTGGQSPFAAVLGCADSRVVPEIIFDTGLGELFTVRVGGNIANVASIASIEFAVSLLNVKLILVMGHSDCGAVNAAVNGGDYSDNLKRILTHIKPAIEQTPSGNITEIIKRNAVLNANDLIERSKIISKTVKKGEVKIIPAFYNLESGFVEFLENGGKIHSGFKI